MYVIQRYKIRVPMDCWPVDVRRDQQEYPGKCGVSNSTLRVRTNYCVTHLNLNLNLTPTKCLNMPLLNLPNEILIQVGKELGPRDLDCLIRTNRHLDFLLTPVLHKLAVHSEVHQVTVFSWAAGKGHVRLLSSLIDHGSDIHAFSKTGCTALMTATYQGQIDAIRLLLDRGASATAQNPEGRGECALHWAAMLGQTEAARMLLENGADVDAKDVHGDTPLHSAVLFSLELSRLLLENGADVDARNELGETPLLHVIRDGDLDRHETDMCEAQPEQDLQAETPEEEVVAHPKVAGASRGANRLAIARTLLDKGANIHLMNNLGITPLHCAASNGYTGMVKILLKYGADITSRDLRERTPLFSAAEGSYKYRYRGNDGHIAVMRLLLEKGADIHTKDCDGWAIRKWGSSGNVLFCDLLEEMGQDVEELREYESGPDTCDEDDEDIYGIDRDEWEIDWSEDEDDDNEDDDDDDDEANSWDGD